MVGMVVGRKFIVSGRVQGVGYRYFAMQTAAACQVVGTVRNVGDGTVEIIAEGSEAAMEKLRNALEQGPSYARVTGVTETQLPVTGRYKTFDVGF